MKYVHYFETESAYTEARESEYEEPWVSYTVETSGVSYNKTEREKLLETPLTFEITSEGNIKWRCFRNLSRTIQYKKNDGEWTEITSTTAGIPISVVSGDTVQFRGDDATYATGSAYSSFSGTTATFSLKGNIMSLIDSDDFINLTTLSSSYTFKHLFYNCTGLTSGEKLILPATTLADNCYQAMFYGCAGLTSAPALPATELGSSCYNDMFGGCTSLTTAPALPATTLADNCYQAMFYGCTSLTTAPVLPATTLKNNCYQSMFEGCTSLISAPELPATTLANYCYAGMFRDCTSLTSAPVLPATTLAANYCYSVMFYGCANLNYIKAMFTTTPSTTYTQNWVSGVAANGTFVKNSEAQWNVRGVHGIPDNWTVETASS